MPDVIDYANDRIELVLEQHIAAARIAVIGESAFECKCCGNPIPEARRRAGLHHVR